MKGNLTLDDAMRLKPGDKVVFNPYMSDPAIRDQVRGIAGLASGMSLEPGREYTVRSIELQRGTPIQSYHEGRDGMLYGSVNLIPDNTPRNVVILLEGDKVAGHDWFRV
ncbi:MAG: hypothetical protein HY513_01270 [Candidatus Aenigmarchaeota archaeon]|nr:hypothetical protein [Candidatus Aenigmarchaeota archaeon]